MTPKEAFENVSDAIQKFKINMLKALEPILLPTLNFLRKLLEGDAD